VTIQSAANDVTAPLVSTRSGRASEVDDTIIVRATDASAIAWIGFRVDTGAAGILLKFDTLNVAAGNLTDVTRRASLTLAPCCRRASCRTHRRARLRLRCGGGAQLLVHEQHHALAHAPLSVARAGKGSGPSPSPNALIDTVIVVTASRFPLQGAGSIADAI